MYAKISKMLSTEFLGGVVTLVSYLEVSVLGQEARNSETLPNFTHLQQTKIGTSLSNITHSCLLYFPLHLFQ